MSRLAALSFAALLGLSLPMLATDALAEPAPAGSAQPVAASPEATAQTITKVQAFYDSTTSFVSQFTQEFFVKSHNVRKESKGKVTFSKPGKMSWEYETPAGNRVVSDGSTLRVYEAANKQLFEQSIDKSQYPAALSFLTGTGKLSDAFTFVMYPGASMNFPGGNVLVGTPKKETAAYTKVLFYVDTSTHHIRRALIVDAQGNRNRFDFLDAKVNVKVDDAAFKLVVPPDTHVIKP
jgi:outer membrane lipoprotein carrier protein